MSTPVLNPDRPTTPLHLLELLLPCGQVFTIPFEPALGDDFAETEAHITLHKPRSQEFITIVKAQMAVVNQKITTRKLTDHEWDVLKATAAQAPTDAA